MKFIYLTLLTTLITMAACNNESNNTNGNTENPPIEGKLKRGDWRAVLYLNEDKSLELPFVFNVEGDEKLTIINAEERIQVTDITIEENGNVSIKMPVFDSEIKAKIKEKKKGEMLLVGAWHNYNKKDYSLAFEATHGDNIRFHSSFLKVEKPTKTVAGKWEVMFSPGTEDAYPAMGIFEQTEDGKVSGTFLTETGDYRYLEGVFDDSNIELSCFDGAHAFLFKAQWLDGKLKGIFFSGKHSEEPWVAERKNQVKLAKMDTLTYLKPGYDRLEFSFPNLKKEMVSLSDPQFQNKAVIVQILGSWCPNCMDETRFLVELHNKYHKDGLEIIGIDYEVINRFEKFEENITKLKKDLNIPYTMVFGGAAKKSEASKTLPMLNHIMSYPTAIFIDRQGNIQKIHTGFAGPGTGEYYEDYKKSTIALVDSLLQ
ncbi:MAG: TlpA family protein disulfide reductase [Aureispira sp.]|nr:TlpA family protein disulfide reductase [Aureispira sp.]